MQQEPPPPFIVRIIEPNKDVTGLRAVLLGSLGLSGVLILLAVLAAIVFGAVLFWLRSRTGDSSG